MQTEITEHMMFLTPSYSTQLSDIDNNKIIQEAYDLKEKMQSVKKSNFGGWQSIDFIPSNMFNGPETQKLVKEITEIVFGLGQMWGFDNIVLNNFWFNINNKKDFNYPHTHTSSIFSAVYYVKCNEDSGRIIFNRPDQSFHYVPPSEENSYRWSEFYFTPKEGLLVIFPSYVEHYVEPSNSFEDRISIALNFEQK